MYSLKLPLLKTPRAALNVTAKAQGEAASENSWWRVQAQDSSLHSSQLQPKLRMSLCELAHIL